MRSLVILHRFTTICVALLFVSTLTGCGENKPSAEDIMARDDLTDAEAIESAVRIKFFDPPELAVTAEPDGIVVSVTMHTDKDAELKTLSGHSPAAMNASKELMMSVFSGRSIVELGGKRNLKRLIINIRQTVIGESGQPEDVDVFGYAVSKDRFDKYLTTGSAADLAKGNARRTIDASCEVLYDRFSGIEFQEAVE